MSLSVCIFTIIPAHSYTLTQTQDGKNIRWHYGQKFFLAGNTTNNSGLSSETIWSAVVNGLQQWKRATQGIFDFEYWQGTNPAVFETVQKQDGLNSIFFASQTNQKTDPNIIGFTQVWFNSNTGDLIESDIILNDRDYILTDNPSDTSSRNNDGGKRVYLNNVITHELGHALGLSHSSSINSSMLFVEFLNQYKIGCDDWSAAKHLYPTSNNGMGSLTGTIVNPFNHPVAGAVVTAISIARGVPIASVVTDQAGKFNFGAIENGSFSLLIEPYQGTPSSVPTRMRVKTNFSVCDQNEFPANFITENDSHTLKSFVVHQGEKLDLGGLQLKCTELMEAGIETSNQSTGAWVDRGTAGTSKTYTFNATGPFKISALGYLLLSPIKVSLSIFDASGVPIATTSVQDPNTLDPIVSGSAFGTITIKADLANNDLTLFPSPAVLPGKTPYFVMVFSEDDQTQWSSSIPNNPRCESNEPYSKYQSPAGDPIRDSTSTSSRDGVGFCGNSYAAGFYDRPHVRHKKSTDFGSLIGWAFPFLVAVACRLFLNLRRSKMKE